MFGHKAMWMGAAVGVLLGGAALADLPNLPREITFPQTGESPGKVTFRHETHVDTTKVSCVGCHPATFTILGRSAETRRETITHAAMEKQGQACGKCHGKQAFGFDDCTMCHAM
jgi:c(7)-type cytochrome triheme protein